MSSRESGLDRAETGLEYPTYRGWAGEILSRVDAMIAWFERCRLARTNTFWVSLVLSVCSLATACPDYRQFRCYAGSLWAGAALDWKFQHPLARIPVAQFAVDAPPGGAGIAEQLEKRSYRIALPLMAKLLGANTRWVLMAQQIGAVLFLGVTVIVSRRVVKDSVCALFVGLAFATSFVGQWGFNDFNNFDGLGLLILLLMLWSRSGAALAALTVLGGLCDERVELAVPLVWVWHAVSLQERSAEVSASRLLVPRPQQAGLLIGFAGFIVIRLALGLAWGQIVSTSGMSWGVFKNNVLWLPLALVGGAKGGLLLFVLSTGILWARRRWLDLRIGALAWTPGLLAALAVYDLTRSLAYGFPAYFLALGVLGRTLTVKGLRRLLFCAAVLCLALPTYWVLLRVYVLLPVVRFV